MSIFSNNMGMFALNTPPRTDNGANSGVVGGAAPGDVTIGVRRDFGFVPQFLPSMTINGGLKQPPRG